MTRNMEHASVGLERIVASSLRRAPSGEGPVFAWPLACGQAVAARTTALEFADGVLRVQVPDAGWRAELQALAPQYLAVINRYVAESVKKVEFVVKGKDFASKGVRPLGQTLSCQKCKSPKKTLPTLPTSPIWSLPGQSASGWSAI